MDKCKFQAFGKISVKTTTLVNKEVDDISKKKSSLLQQGDASESIQPRLYKQPVMLQLNDTQKLLIDKCLWMAWLVNKNTIIRVKTGVGMNGEQETGETIGQGTGEGAIIARFQH